MIVLRMLLRLQRVMLAGGHRWTCWTFVVLWVWLAMVVALRCLMVFWMSPLVVSVGAIPRALRFGGLIANLPPAGGNILNPIRL